LKIAVAAVGVLAVLLVAGPFVYIHFVEGDPPPKLTLDVTSGNRGATSTSAASSTDDSDITGAWKVTSGSEAGYRAKEVLFGQDATAVGRTSGVTGSMAINGSTITSAKVVVDMRSVSSDRSLRDSQFKGRIMDVSSFPSATFELVDPIVLASLPADGTRITTKATGKLTLHGVTKTVTFDLNGLHGNGVIKVQGSIPIHFADYRIDNPSGGPAKVGDDGELEFLVQFTRA
jgi:polyisoprenoid-binding protein YceI